MHDRRGRDLRVDNGGGGVVSGVLKIYLYMLYVSFGASYFFFFFFSYHVQNT